MAWVHSNIATISYTVKDDDLATSVMSFSAKLPSLVQWTQAALDKTKEVLWEVISPLIDSALVSSVASLASYDDALPVPAAGSDVEDKGVFLMTTENNRPGTFALASILESKLVDTGIGAGIQIDFLDSDVAAFETAITDGIDLSPWSILDTVRFGTDRGEPWSLTRDGYKQNRRSHKSRNRKG